MDGIDNVGEFNLFCNLGTRERGVFLLYHISYYVPLNSRWRCKLFEV